MAAAISTGPAAMAAPAVAAPCHASALAAAISGYRFALHRHRHRHRHRRRSGDGSGAISGIGTLSASRCAFSGNATESGDGGAVWLASRDGAAFGRDRSHPEPGRMGARQRRPVPARISGAIFGNNSAPYGDGFRNEYRARVDSAILRQRFRLRGGRRNLQRRGTGLAAWLRRDREHGGQLLDVSLDHRLIRLTETGLRHSSPSTIHFPGLASGAKPARA
jgi:hypothetical protein